MFVSGVEIGERQRITNITPYFLLSSLPHLAQTSHRDDPGSVLSGLVFMYFLHFFRYNRMQQNSV